jgi:uncharacterized protein YccT (UPF0319 family)
MSRTMMSVAVIALAVIAAHGTASANLSRGVINAFRGQLIISAQELPEGKNDKETIAKIKAAKLSALTGEAQEDVTYWNFHYAAFLSKTGNTKLKMEFYNGKQLAADKTLDSIDPKSGLLLGNISINEDEGLSKGKTYTIKLVTTNDATVASATLTMK